ncbi:MAG: spermidine synthase [Alphaproteobacteria bacterium]
MSTLFRELAYQETPIGAVSLRQRRILALDTDVLEIMLGDEHLMSSLFTASEIALAKFGIAALDGNNLDVVVGGLGLGYTAKAVLEDVRVGSLTVVELLDPVVDWHEQGLLPLGPVLTGDDRTRFHRGDFFALAAGQTGFDAAQPGRQFDAILIDIDHTPDRLLDDRSTGFYSETGLRALSGHLRNGGVMGLWSDEPPDAAFLDRLSAVFASAWAEPVTFDNPYQPGQPVTQTVYFARKAG